MKTDVKLRIANIVILLQSKFRLEQFDKNKKDDLRLAERLDNFIYGGGKRPDILIEVKITKDFPRIDGAKPVFTSYHFQNHKQNWHLFKKNNRYIYYCPLSTKRQVIFVNRRFNLATAYLLPQKNKNRTWKYTDIIYDFLQVMLINYFALRENGIIFHAIGVKDIDGNGLLFAGRSGMGKSTTARIWHRHSRATVLNDDRIIVRELNGRFIIYGSPWHGNFNDYLYSTIEPAILKKIFFIHHAPKNTVEQISRNKAFNLLYPTLFPVFWDKQSLENIISFCQKLIKNVPCFNLGFINDKRIIEFVRSK